ncbi:hypothetical protein [Spongiimicrobium sp. 3-5]|uniref:hypothetical protein n=1 Tax=Spongiimicrobium sp. 3-5 TaxID=3332596 RepID=UPI00397ECB61
MVTFVSILFGLIAINAILLVFSVNGANQKNRPTEKGISETPAEIYPIDLITSKYKKAV